MGDRKITWRAWPARVPRWAQRVGRWWWPGTTWSEADRDAVFLTFDDGPFPEVTPWVMDALERRNAKATFFMVGAQALRHPELARSVVARGHGTGNHTMNHEHGWHTSLEAYLEAVTACDEALSSLSVPSALFRPPHGKLTRSQAQALARSKNVVMWDVLAGDFVEHADPQDVLRRLKAKTKGGNIVVLHDSPKAWPTLKEVLPDYLDWLGTQGLQPKALPV